MEMLLAVLLVMSPLIGICLTRRPVMVALVEVVSLGISGMSVELMNWGGYTWSRASISVLLIFSRIMSILIYAALCGQRRNHSPSTALAGLFSLAIFPAVFLLRAWMTRPELSTSQSGVLVDLGYFLSGEDNAKWLNTFSQISQSGHIRVSGVGGVFVVAAMCFWLLAKLGSGVLSLPYNQQSLTLNGLYTMQVGLVLLSPFALLPLITQRSTSKGRSRLVAALVTSWLLLSFVDSPRPIGHLSVQLVVVLGVLGIGAVVSTSTSTMEKSLGWLTLSLASTVWLGLRLLPLVIFVFMMFSWRRNFGGTRRSQVAFALLTVGFLSPIGTVWETVSYTHRTASTLDELFAATGGFIGVATTTTVIFGIVLLAGILELSRTAVDMQIRWTTEIVLLTISYAFVVAINDLLRTGKVNYGSFKLWYMVVAILMCVFLPFAVSYVRFAAPANVRHVVLPVVGLAMLMTMTIDGVFSRSVGDLNGKIWDGAVQASDRTYRDFVRTNIHMPQPLSELPIGCVQFAQDGTLLTSGETYTCTRILAAFSGQEENADPLNLWQLQQYRDTTLSPADIWSKGRGYLLRLPEHIRAMSLIVLDAGNHVVSQITIDDLLSKYP